MSPEEANSELIKSSFLNCFREIQDERSPAQTRYPMQEVLFLVVSSVVSGYESNRGIEEFGVQKLDWLRKYFPFRQGIPTHESIGNIIGLVDKKVFEECFIRWVEEDYELSGDLIHIDGKRISGSADKMLQDKMLQDKKAAQGGQRAEIFVNAYASGSNTVIAQVNVSESGDEKVGAQELIRRLHLKGKTITGDGNFCYRALLKQIRSKGGDYMMTLKRNQPKLYEICTKYFEEYILEQSAFQTANNGHGRYEIRLYYSLPIHIFEQPKFKEYSGLSQLVKVVRVRTELRKQSTTTDTHYYITSSDKKIEVLAQMIRKHWSVENQLHWVLDVEFKEDASRKRSGNQASNFSIIRKLVLNLINKNKGKKSIKAMRMACALSDKVRHDTLGFS